MCRFDDLPHRFADGQHSGNSRLSALGRAGQIHRVGDLVEPVLEQAEHLLHDL